MGHALRWILLPAAAIGTIVGVGVATGGGGSAIMAALADPLSLLAARSPGARPDGALTQTKLRRTPGEHVLSDALTRPLDRFAAPGQGGAPGAEPVDTVGDTVSDAVADAAMPGTADTGSSGGIGVGFIPTSGSFVVAPDVGGGAGGGGSAGGGGGGGGTSTTTPTTPVTSPPTDTPVVAVPEPETWLTLLIGFGAVGGALRSRRRGHAGQRNAATLASRA